VSGESPMGDPLLANLGPREQSDQTKAIVRSRAGGLDRRHRLVAEALVSPGPLGE